MKHTTRGGEEDDSAAMKPEELQSWKDTYATVESIEAEISYQISKENENINKHQLSFTPVLAKLCYSKDNPDAFVQHHGSLYMWVWRYKQVFACDEAQPVVEHIRTVKAVVG